jgi:hypothetical protein
MAYLMVSMRVAPKAVLWVALTEARSAPYLALQRVACLVAWLGNVKVELMAM